MRFFRQRLASIWVIVPLCALGFLIWVDLARLHRVEEVSALPGWSTAVTSGRSRLIVPQHNNESYQWLMQTRLMLERGEWRMRQVDYDNAPLGRVTHAPAPYRWWLGLMARCAQTVFGHSLALSVEQAALYGDPLLHLLSLVAVVVFTAWQFGIFPSVLLAVGLVTIFPLAGGFLPGAPDHHGFAWICALESMLLLLAAFGAKTAVANNFRSRQRRWFFLAGQMGGLGFWINASSQIPLLLGIGLGALLSAALARKESKMNPTVAALGVPPWRAWGWGGAAMSLAAYVMEYFPSHLGWQLEVNHPLYAGAWLGGTELLARAVDWLYGSRPNWKIRDKIRVGLALLAVAAVPLAMVRLDSRGLFTVNPLATRLTCLSDFAAPNLAAWVMQDGFTRLVAATTLPVLLIVPAVIILFRRRTIPRLGAAIAVALGPVLLALGLACFQLSGWSMCDGVLLVMLVAASAAAESENNWRNRSLWSVSLAAVVALGVFELIPEHREKAEESLDEVDVEGLVERDLAVWLAQRAGTAGAVVYAPPNVTATLAYHGGLRGVGTFSWENHDGLAAAVRLASATSPEEAQALVQRRGIAYLVIPSWDRMLDQYAQRGSLRAENSFMVALHRWALPSWLRPVPYTLPAIGGFEKQSVVVLEVVDEQEPSVAFSRLAEYFVETGQMDLATATRSGLQRFTGDLGALTALALVEAGLGEKGDFASIFKILLTNFNPESAAVLPWERRVNLAIVLAHGKRFDLARTQVQYCLLGLDEIRLRSLTTAALFRLQLLAKKFGLEISDPRLQELAIELLPPGTMRERLAK